MSSLFGVDSSGIFRVTADSLRANKSLAVGNKFLVRVVASDSQGVNHTIIIIVQLSKFVDENRCPKISSGALCHFVINQTDFDPSLYCFY